MNYLYFNVFNVMFNYWEIMKNFIIFCMWCRGEYWFFYEDIGNFLDDLFDNFCEVL